MKEKQRIHTKWTVEDKLLLYKLVNQNTSQNRIKWQDVAYKLQRTVNQCKTYYRNVLQTESLQNQSNQGKEYVIHRDTLMKFMYFYENDWEAVKKCFSELNQDSLLHQYIQIQQQWNRILSVIDIARRTDGTINYQYIENSLSRESLNFYIKECQKCQKFIQRLRNPEMQLICNEHELMDMAVFKKLQHDKIDLFVDQFLNHYLDKTDEIK